MELFERRITHEAQEMHAEGGAHPLQSAGAALRCRPSLVARIEWAEALTRSNTRITLFIAFNYGGRAEIVDAARTFQGTTEADFKAHLYAPDMHDPDLLIRTSGEQRISNYLVWQTRLRRARLL